MPKGSDTKKAEKEKQPTYPPSAAMRRRQAEEEAEQEAERERLQQEKADKRKKNILPPPPVTGSGTVVAGKSNAGNGEDGQEVDDLAEYDGKALLAKGGKDVDKDGDIKMKEVKHDADEAFPSPESQSLQILIKRFEANVNKENLFRSSLAKHPTHMRLVLSALSKERETITSEMKAFCNKLGVQVREVENI
ncbi:hypothetical protein NCC49_001359 [Naganishia albida]|nr:hypothetical protein NCC49_001359 [Naganishia albida]